MTDQREFELLRKIEALVADRDRLRAALTNIADGNIPREMLEQWQGLSEEAWYEQNAYGVHDPQGVKGVSVTAQTKWRKPARPPA